MPKTQKSKMVPIEKYHRYMRARRMSDTLTMLLHDTHQGFQNMHKIDDYTMKVFCDSGAPRTALSLAAHHESYHQKLQALLCHRVFAEYISELQHQGAVQ